MNSKYIGTCFEIFTIACAYFDGDYRRYGDTCPGLQCDAVEFRPENKPGLTDLEEQDPEGEGGMFEHFRFVADKGQQLLRVDKFLVDHLQKSSRNRIQQAAVGIVVIWHPGDSPAAGCLMMGGFVHFAYDFRIKKGGNVYLTVVAFSPKLITVPDFYNVSARQARSMYEGLS